MNLSIIIVNWNSKAHVRACLQALDRSEPPLEAQIVVVDGGSFDGCGDMLRAEFPAVRFVQSPDNVGFGRSNNLGFEHSTGEAVLFLNPDTEVEPGAMANLMKALESLPDCGIVGARLFNTDGSLQRSCVQPFPTAWNQSLDCGRLQVLLPRLKIWGNHLAFSTDAPTPVEAVSGACILMRRRVFSQVGGFSPEFFMYGEDLDLCAKVRRAGLKVYHVPQARITHHGGGSSSGAFSKFSSVYLRESVFRLIRSHRGPVSAGAYRVAMAMTSIIRMAFLAPACALSVGSRVSARRNSLRKWLVTLRWSAGMERRVAQRS